MGVPETRKILGHAFADTRLLEEALTHASYANENNLEFTSERLEFLGDAVLQLAVSHFLCTAFPDAPEGDLSRKRAVLVCEETLAEWASEIGLASSLRLGKGLLKSGGLENASVMADAAEAVLGAIYLDAGFAKALDVVFRFCSSRRALLTRTDRNPKALLQERLESQGKSRPEYHLLKTDGPAHEPLHTVKLTVDGKTLVTATGKTIREAETKAAEKVLSSM